MAITLQLAETYSLKGFSFKRRNLKKYDTAHSSVDALIVTNSANKYIDNIINNGSISCNRS